MTSRFFWTVFRHGPHTIMKHKLFYLKGSRESEVNSWAEECWRERVKPTLFSGMVEGIKYLKSQDIKVVLLSGTPTFLAKPLLEFLEIGDLMAAEPEVGQGRLTGAVVRPHPMGVRKVEECEGWLEANGLEWNQVGGIANHFADRFLLSRVAVAIAVSPDDDLAKLARSKNWPIITEDEARNAKRAIEILRGVI